MKKYFIVLLVFFLLTCSKKESQRFKITGPVFGTSYSIIYDGFENYKKSFDSLYLIVNKSFSNYDSNSDISKINRNESFIVDNHFITVFEASKKIYDETKGVFDPTIGKLVNAWDFGSKKTETLLNTLKIDSLMQFVGLNKISITNNKLKKIPEAFIDFNAIAKGYGVDVIAKFLESKNIVNYLVEIGGEIRVKGINTKTQLPWLVGLNQPRFDGEQSVLKTISLNNEAMATSGTYRKFKVDADGKRYAHIIDAKTGHPSKSNILSVSVIAKNCMLADGYATSFQAMGLIKTKVFLTNHKELKAFIIFENSNQEFDTLSVNGFPE